MDFLRGDACHEYLIDNIRPKLTFNPEADYGKWKQRVEKKFLQLIGDLPSERCPTDVNIEYRTDKGGYDEIRFSYASETCCRVPAYLLIPHGVCRPPVAICLQGHSTGMHISLGVAKYPGDETSFPRAAHAINAVARGYAALVIEQRGMGERKSPHTDNDNFTAYTALLIGRTIIGERIWDISRGIDALGEFGEVDVSKIICIGNSGGGTATYYAACFDDRISIAVPSCAVCSYKESIGSIFHCPCNYIPGVMKWMDMGELAALIAPRRLAIFAGKKDQIFLIQGVRQVYDTVRRIYEKEDAKENCALYETDEGHWFCHEQIWPVVDELAAKAFG